MNEESWKNGGERRPLTAEEIEEGRQEAARLADAQFNKSKAQLEQVRSRKLKGIAIVGVAVVFAIIALSAAMNSGPSDIQTKLLLIVVLLAGIALFFVAFYVNLKLMKIYWDRLRQGTDE